jgi:hypothetical protein
MVKRYFGGVISATQATANSTSARGFWSTTNQVQLKQAGNWPLLPVAPTTVEYLVVGGGGAGAGIGGGGGVNVGYAGGSGVVIIRYADTFLAASATTGSPTITVASGYRVYTFTGSGSITF